MEKKLGTVGELQRYTLTVRAAAERGMYGCGVFVLNAPWKLSAERADDVYTETMPLARTLACKCSDPSLI